MRVLLRFFIYPFPLATYQNFKAITLHAFLPVVVETPKIRVKGFMLFTTRHKRDGAKGRTRTYDTGINNSITFFVCIADAVFFNTGKISVLPALPTELPWHIQVRFLARLDLL